MGCHFMIKTDETFIKTKILEATIVKKNKKSSNSIPIKKISNKAILDPICLEKAKKALVLQKQIATRLKKVISLKTLKVDVNKSEIFKNYFGSINSSCNNSNEFNNVIHSGFQHAFEDNSKIDNNTKKFHTRFRLIKIEVDHKKVNIDSNDDKPYIEWWDKN